MGTNEAGFEAKHHVRETLRERRLALLNPGNASGLSEMLGEIAGHLMVVTVVTC